MRLWPFEEWSALIGSSLFEQVGAWDGRRPERPRQEVAPSLEDQPLTWHELARG